MGTKSLCEKCSKILEGAVIYPYDVNKNILVSLYELAHCHHDEEKPKEKCWCEKWESLKYKYLIYSSGGVFDMKANFCPECGKKL